MQKFGQILKDLLESRHISKYRLTKDLGLGGKCSVKYWIDGTYEPKASDIVKLAQYFNVTTDYLLGLDDKSDAKYVNSFNSASINAGGDVNL